MSRDYVTPLMCMCMFPCVRMNDDDDDDDDDVGLYAVKKLLIHSPAEQAMGRWVMGHWVKWVMFLNGSHGSWVSVP